MNIITMLHGLKCNISLRSVTLYIYALHEQLVYPRVYFTIQVTLTIQNAGTTPGGFPVLMQVFQSLYYSHYCKAMDENFCC